MSSNKRDMRREDLIVPYTEPKADKDSQDAATTMSSTLPMAAIFMRNKIIGWTAVLFSLQQWLSETPAQKEASGSPAYFSVGMSLMAVAVAYMPLFLPPQQGKGAASGGTGTGVPAPAGS